MSNREWLEQINTIKNEELLEELENCGHDFYYNDIYYAIVEEIKRRLEVEDMGVTEWIEFGQNKDGTHSIMCSRCGGKVKSKGHARSVYTRQHFKYCPVCGERMQAYVNTTEYIVGIQSKGE